MGGLNESGVGNLDAVKYVCDVKFVIGAVCGLDVRERRITNSPSVRSCRGVCLMVMRMASGISGSSVNVIDSTTGSCV